MQYLDIDNLDHDPALATDLGQMIVAWARAETSLVNVFAAVTDVHFNMATVAYYRIPTFEARVKVILAIISVAKFTPESLRDDLSRAIEKLAKLASARNHWVHGLWCVEKPNPTKSVIFDFRAPPNTPGRVKPAKANDVRTHIAAVKQRTRDIDQIIPLKVKTLQPATP